MYDYSFDIALAVVRAKAEKLEHSEQKDIQQSQTSSRSDTCRCARCIADYVVENLGIINEEDGWIDEEEQEECDCAQCAVQGLGIISEKDGWVEELECEKKGEKRLGTNEKS